MIFSLSIFTPLYEKTIEVLVLDNGRNAKGPNFVKTWMAISLSLRLWFIIKVYALLS